MTEILDYKSKDLARIHRILKDYQGIHTKYNENFNFIKIEDDFYIDISNRSIRFRSFCNDFSQEKILSKTWMYEMNDEIASNMTVNFLKKVGWVESISA